MACCHSELMPCLRLRLFTAGQLFGSLCNSILSSGQEKGSNSAPSYLIIPKLASLIDKQSQDRLLCPVRAL